MDIDELGQKTLTVSWSRMHEWEMCGMKAALHMAGKRDSVKDGRRFLHGTLADRAMRMWLEQESEHLPGQMEAYVDELWEEHAIKSPEYKIEWKGDPKKDMEKVRNLAKKVVRNVEPFLYKRVLPYEYHPELRFRVPVRIPDANNLARTIILNGGMDIAVRDPATGLVSLYDLKATENENYVHQGIMPQLIFYSLAWTFMHGDPGENIRAAFLTPACKQQYHELKIDSESRRHLMTRIVSFAHAVWSGQEPVCTQDNSICYFCDVKSHCPRWSNVVVQDDGKGHRVSLVETAKRRELANDQAK